MTTSYRNLRVLNPTPAIALAIVLVCGGTSLAAKPNFVITIADDHGVYHSSVYGSNEFQTPNLQQMANEGIRFDNAYVASPACAPSRAALFTGRMPYNNGIVGNHEFELKPGVSSLLPVLLDEGYEVVFHGKVGHAGRKHFGQYVPDGVKILGGGGLQQTMTLDQVESFLQGRPENAPPLALFLGWTDTHTAWPPKEEARIAPEDVVIPPKIFDTPEARVEMTRYVEAAEDIDRRVGQTRELIAEYLDVNNTLAVYTSDHGMPWPFAKWSLYETGIRTPLIAVWPGKIKPASSTDAMVSWIDLIPTLIDLAGGTSPSGIDGRSFAKVLFGETDKHRDAIFATHKGDKEKNVYPIRSVRVGKWKYIRNLHPEFAYTTHTDVWAKETPRDPKHWAHAGHHWQSYLDAAKTDPSAAAFLLDYHSNPAEELYELASDPFEKNNLASSSEQAGKLAELRELLDNRMREVADDRSLSGPPQLLKDFPLPQVTLTKQAPAAAKKPNVLFLISDDLNTALSGFGHKQCKTPNLDRLARRGVKFENMHCQYPVCGASRASIMSGLYPYSNLTLGNEGTLRGNLPDVVTLSQTFRNNGYYAGRISKIYHMGIPFEIIEGTSESDDPFSWDEAINIKGPEQNAPGELTNWSPKNKGSQNFTGVVATGGDSEHADGMAADRAIEMLSRVRDQPFFLAVGFVRPHVPLVAPKKYFDQYKRDEMLAPVVPQHDLDDVPRIIRGYKRNSTTYGVTPELHKGLLQAYYASVSYMDAQVGRVLDALEEQGLAENTIVVFTSDHGYLLGHHNKYQKQHLFEEATRVPFIISVPWLKEQHGRGTTKITELVDLYPTLTELAGIPAPGTLQGTSLKPLLLDIESPAWNKEQAFTISRSGGESIRTADWRFTQWGFGENGLELYDLNNDPGEFTNQARNPDYASVVKKLRAQLIAKRDAAGFKQNQKAIVDKSGMNKQKK
ncbi:sulfatase-like hydrolase/transferase [Rosistilla oblonga]|uniref:sulfatase-like hydrolase/transferase n=1 Tax=Rosistilla oblonga TaxID=2527990 RepID=UPI003A985638